MVSNPWIRVTSSTKSASPSMSGRHEGGTVSILSFASLGSKPRTFRIRICSVLSISIPANSKVRFGRRLILRFHLGVSPAKITSLGSPPHSSKIIAVAASIPGKRLSGSTPLSKR